MIGSIKQFIKEKLLSDGVWISVTVIQFFFLSKGINWF
jgi:hypothetical protein